MKRWVETLPSRSISTLLRLKADEEKEAVEILRMAARADALFRNQVERLKAINEELANRRTDKSVWELERWRKQ